MTDYIITFLLAFGCIGLFAFCAFMQWHCDRKRIREYESLLESVYREGYKASPYVPATANPYKEQEKATKWLDGWISWQQNKESDGIKVTDSW